jgi:tRNA pseudouridine38-40 synthase
MAERTVQLVLHYDGSGFSGWQRQPEQRTVQGVVEQSLERLCGQPVAALGSGRTDAGVHARGQAVGVRVAEKWNADSLRRALNAVLPDDVWVAARQYRYYVGTDAQAASPFRRKTEYAFAFPVDRAALTDAASSIQGDHSFRAFAVKDTAPESDSHRCNVNVARWEDRPGGLVFVIEANRFLHHMVRFLVGTMLDVASGRRPLSDIAKLLGAPDNLETSSPAPAQGLFLEAVTYPRELYA